MSQGIFYVATGEEFLKEAEISASRVKEVMPDISITLLTDVNVDTQDYSFDNLMHLENPSYSSRDRIKNLAKSPYDRSLCLDTDIYIDGEIYGIFDILDEFDIAATINQEGNNPKGDPDVPTPFPELNTGVLLYQNDDQFYEFLEEWEDLYLEHRQFQSWPNQPSFRETLFKSDLRIATLPSEYNLMVRSPGHVRAPVKMFHGRLYDFYGDGVGTPRYINTEKFAKKLNKSDEHRVYSFGWNVKVHKNSILWDAKKEYAYNGVRGLIDKGAKKIYNFIRS